jgi:hypothetical protein
MNRQVSSERQRRFPILHHNPAISSIWQPAEQYESGDVSLPYASFSATRDFFTRNQHIPITQDEDTRDFFSHNQEDIDIWVSEKTKGTTALELNFWLEVRERM